MGFSDKFGQSKNVKQIGHVDIPGGGQVVVQGNHAFAGHMAAPDGTTILDVSDPTGPRVLSQLKVPKGIHSHKVRVAGDIMIVNQEEHGSGGTPFDVGLKVYDISDMDKPQLLSHLDWSPPYPCPTHTALRIPHKLLDRDFLLVTDEDVDRLSPNPSAFMWMVDVTDERNPISVSTYRPTCSQEFVSEGVRFGAHQPEERVYDNIICLAWFARGLRYRSESSTTYLYVRLTRIPPSGLAKIII